MPKSVTSALTNKMKRSLGSGRLAPRKQVEVSDTNGLHF
jgi:hypothetical protein